MPFIESPQHASALQRRGSHNEVVGTDNVSARFKLGPDTGVLKRRRVGIWNCRHPIQDAV